MDVGDALIHKVQIIAVAVEQIVLFPKMDHSLVRAEARVALEEIRHLSPFVYDLLKPLEELFGSNAWGEAFETIEQVCAIISHTDGIAGRESDEVTYPRRRSRLRHGTEARIDPI